MGLEDDIVKLLKAEGYKINEVIKDAIDEMLDTVTDEHEAMEDQGEESDDEVEDD